jgi:hypothetical protein
MADPKSSHHPGLAVAYEAHSLEEAEVVRALLEGEGVPVTMPPDVASLRDPQGIPWKLQEQTEEVLLVPQDRVEEARRIIQENHQPLSEDDDFEVGGEGE